MCNLLKKNDESWRNAMDWEAWRLWGFHWLVLPLVSCLEDSVNNTRSDAHSSLLALSQFSFICTLVVTQTILACTKGLSVELQGRYVNVVRAHKDIEAVKLVLKGFRSEVDRIHDRYYHEALQLAALVEVEESAPRLAGRQRIIRMYQQQVLQSTTG